MKLLVDQNLSDRLSSRMQDQFPGSLHIREVLTRRARDTSIWSYAGDNGFVIVTKDTDYLRLSNERGHPPKVIWIRSGDASTPWSRPSSATTTTKFPPSSVTLTAAFSSSVDGAPAPTAP